MTVWAVNHSKEIDLTPALQYGDLRYVNVRYVYGDEIDHEQMPQSTLDRLEQAARDFDPERDLLLISGDHLQLLDFAARLGARYHYFRVLRWDKKAEGYIPVRIHVSCCQAPYKLEDMG